jgi:hypothetical protein
MQESCNLTHGLIIIGWLLSYPTFTVLLEHGREVIFMHKSNNAVAISKSSGM